MDDDKYRECSADTMFYMIPFFCGQDKFCESPSEASFGRAVQNLKRNFILVGLTEQMDDFFVMLQKIFPVYFRDITNFWRISGKNYMAKCEILIPVKVKSIRMKQRLRKSLR